MAAGEHIDIHQLRSWIFELYEPLENERQYIVFDAARGNLLIDLPPFGARPLRLVQGTGRASLLVATNAAHARAIRVKDKGEGATVVLLRKAGGVLVCGDLDLASEAARQLEKLEFSVVLSARRSPMWNA